MSNPFSATRWILAGSFGFRLLSLGGQMLILREVDKDVFGIYRAIVVIHVMALALLPLSLDTLIVREKHRQARYTIATGQALFFVGLLLAMGSLALMMVPGAGEGSMLASWLNTGAESAALLFMPAIFAVQAIKLSIRSVLAARLDFRTISIGEFGNGLLTWLGGAALVLVFPHAWALMAMYLVGEAFECAWMFRGRPFRPLGLLRPRRLHVLANRLGRHLRYCLSRTGDLVLNNVASLLPTVLITAWISPEANADFSVAMQLIVLPTMLLSGALWRVTFPTMAGLTETELVGRCLRIVEGAAAFIAPVVLWFAVFAPTTVYILAGTDYVDTTTPLIRWICLYMVLSAVYSPIGSLDMIRDRPEVGLVWNAVFLGGRVAIIWMLAGEGLLAVVAGFSLFSFGMWAIHAMILGLLLGAPLSRFFAPLLRVVPLLAAGLLMMVLLHVYTPGYWIGPAASVAVVLFHLAVVRMAYPGAYGLLKRLAGARG